MNNFISSPTETNWRMTPSEFLRHLLARWPQASVRTLTLPSPFAFEWNIQMSHGVLEGEFYRDHSALSINGTSEDCAAFALWFRSLVPPQQALIFYDEGVNFKV